MAGLAHLAVALWEKLSLSKNQICKLSDLPCAFRRYFFGDVKVDGSAICFVIQSGPSSWDALLWRIDKQHVLILSEICFWRTFNDREELTAFLTAVRCAFRKGHVRFVFETQDWKQWHQKYADVIAKCDPECTGECGI